MKLIPGITSVCGLMFSSAALSAAPAQWQSNGALAVVALKAGLVSEIPEGLVADDIDISASRCHAEFQQPLSHDEILAPRTSDKFLCTLVSNGGATYAITIPLNGTTILYWGNNYGPAGFRFVDEGITKELARAVRSMGIAKEGAPAWMLKVEVCDPTGLDCLLSYFIKRSETSEGERLQGMSCSVHVAANDARRTYDAYRYDCAFYPLQPSQQKSLQVE